MAEYKTLEEWRRVYREKEELLHEWGYPEVGAFDFYRELFPEGCLQKKGESFTGKGNVVGNNLMLTRSRKVIISDGLEDLYKLQGGRFGLIGPFSSYGDSYKKEYAHQLFAIAIDIDYVGKVQLKRLLREFQNWNEDRPNSWKRMPPTYLVSSGRGVHLYYFLDKPIELYRHRFDTLSALKTALTNYMWNESTSLKGGQPDKAGITQAFRCVGSLSKICLDKERKKVVTDAYPVKAYKISDRRFSLYEIRDSIEGCTVDIDSLYQLPVIKTGQVSLPQAAELWPEWYDERIVKGLPKRGRKKTWTCNKALYEWWKQKVRSEAIVGGRYFTIVALCCYGRKCGISDWHIRRDAWKLFDYLESITDDEANHFTRQDMRDALDVLNSEDRMQTVEHTRAWIEEKTKIEIPPNKRNHQKREWHLEDMRDKKMRMKRRGQSFKNPEGRPSAQAKVLQYRAAHPDGRKADCNRVTGLDPKTIRKWWDSKEASEDAD